MPIDFKKPGKLTAKPLAGITPEVAKVSTSVVKPTIIPSIPSIGVKPKPSVKPISVVQLAGHPIAPNIANMVSKVKQVDDDILDLDLDANVLLDHNEANLAGIAINGELSPLEEKLRDIEILMEKAEIPVQALKMCCDGIMKDIKASPDTVLDLEPEQIQIIVQGYIKATDAEVQKVLVKQKKAKKTTKPKISAAAKGLLERAAQLELDEDVEF